MLSAQASARRPSSSLATLDNPPEPRHHLERLFGGVVLVQRGDVHGFARGDVAVAGVSHHRRGVDRLTLEQLDDRCRRDLGMLVGQVPRLGHQRRGEGGVAQHVDARRSGGLHRQPVDTDPPIVHVDQAGAAHDVGRTLRRHHVEHVGLDVVEIELGRQGGSVDLPQFIVRAVLEDVLVVLGERSFEQHALGLDLGVGVEHQHLRSWLDALEIVRHQARALIGARRAAKRRGGDRQGIDAAVGHGFDLTPQRRGLRSGPPAVQDALLCGGAVESDHLAGREVDARRHDGAVIAQRTSVGQAHLPGRRIDGHRHGLHPAHAKRFEA